MKAKVLFFQYSDGTGSGVERIYFDANFEQAEKDLKLLQSHSDKKWLLVDTDIYGEQKGILGSSIDFAYFSTRTSGLMKNNGFEKIEDLVKLSQKSLLGKKRFGQIAVSEIADYLYKYGLEIPKNDK
jgi:DNA-directed RNA polymerase alpha subunit